MKLYLSSQKLGNSTTLLLNILEGKNDVAMVANALDDKPASHRQNRVLKELEMLKNIGLNPEELDLRDYFYKPLELGEYLKKKSLIWIRGGNTFILRRAMLEAGFDSVALPLIKKGRLVYGGYSAALLVASQDLLGTELVDDAIIIPPGYSRDTEPVDGLGLLDFHLIPHFESDDPWAEDVVRHRDYLYDNNRRVTVLRDGEVYIFNGDKGEIIR